jgi:ankyrin repeat protein
MHVLSSFVTVGRASTMLTTTATGETALHLACRAIYPTLDLVRYLVANCGVKNFVNQPDHDGKTPLHVACVACPYPSSFGFTFKLVSGKRVRSDQSECLDIVRFLVCEAKADTNIVDKDGKTALDLTHRGSAGPNESVAQIIMASTFIVS